jgi:hypothetical protein
MFPLLGFKRFLGEEAEFDSLELNYVIVLCYRSVL